MAQVVKRRWKPLEQSGLPRRDRQGCQYEAYIPDPLVGRSFELSGAVAADVADAERDITRLNFHARGLVDSEAVARLLLRAEAVASSRIEGLEVGARRLLRAQAARALGDGAGDVTATEVLNNIEAMAWAIGHLSTVAAITTEDILAIHRRLLAGTRLEDHAGKTRTEQNWIGGSSYNPCSAAFIPPPPAEVERLRRPRRLLQHRQPARRRSGCDRARPVLDHPPLRRWQRTRRTRTDSRHPSPSGHRTHSPPARLPGARHLV